MNPGLLIATNLVLLYAILGPLVILGIYVLFDALAGKSSGTGKQTSNKKDPALWTRHDCRRMLR